MNSVLATLITVVFEIFSFLILVEVIASWVMVTRVRLPDIVYTILQAVHSITGVVLNPLRRVIPPIGGLDLTPIIALLLLQLLQRLLVDILL